MGRRPAGPAGLALLLGIAGAAASAPAPLVPFRPLTPAEFRFQPFRALPFGDNATWAFTVSCCECRPWRRRRLPDKFIFQENLWLFAPPFELRADLTSVLGRQHNEVLLLGGCGGGVTEARAAHPWSRMRQP
eukprot:COSAG03_NODE_3603_length_1924_cov_25.251507_2_plen_132_part_00